MSDSLTFRLPIHSELTDPSDVALRAAVEQALAQAKADAKSEYAVDADGEVTGAFGGVGEGAIVLTILHLLKEGGTELGKGALEAAGAVFVNKYLVPLLRKHNILPGEPKVVPTKEDDAESDDEES